MVNNTIQVTRSVFLVWATAVTQLNNETDNFVTLSNNSSSTLVQNISDRKAEMKVQENSTAPFNVGIQWDLSKVGVLIAQVLIMLETIFGNFLVVASVALEKKLQTPFNYYIVNLALTDMNVGLSVMPLFALDNLYGYFPFDVYTCSYWIWSDYTMTFESVATLAVISIDRFWSVTWSIHYRQHNSGRKSIAIISATWIFVNAVWLPAFIYDRVVHIDGPGQCEWNPSENVKSVIYVGILGYYLPLTIMLVAYCRIFYVMKKRMSQINHNRAESRPLANGPLVSVTAEGEMHRQAKAPPAKNDVEISRLRKEKKAFYTLGHVVIIFLICWIPFYLLFMIDPLKPNFFPSWYGAFSYWMAYINSAVNPLVYGIGNDDFRRSFKKILTCGCFRKSQPQRPRAAPISHQP